MPTSMTYSNVIHSLKKNIEEHTPILPDSFPLAAVKTSLVLGTQPLYVGLRMQQKSVGGDAKPLNLTGAFKVIGEEKKLSPFFRGGVAAAAKEGFKYGVYKVPLLKGAPGIVDQVLPEDLYRLPLGLENIVRAGAAGTFAATIDTALGGGFEAYSTYRATSQGVHKAASFTDELKVIKSPLGKLGRIYKGAIPATATGSVAFSTFFALDKPATQYVSTLYAIDEKETKPFYVTATASMMIGSAVALTSSPFDIVKTMVQMPDPNNKGVMQSLNDNVKRHGISGLTAGIGTRASMVVLGWSTNHFFINKMKEKNEDVLQTSDDKPAPKIV